MASAFGGQRSIQLSYGCVGENIAEGLVRRNWARAHPVSTPTLALLPAQAVKPPSTVISLPVMYLASSEARNRAA